MLKELEQVIERLMKRIKHLIEGGQEAGIEHARDLQAAVNGLKIHVAAGAETVADLAVQGTDFAQKEANSALVAAGAAVQSVETAVVGEPDTNAPKVSDTQPNEGVHTIASEISGAAGLSTPDPKSDLTIPPFLVKTPAPVTTPGNTPEDVVKSDEIKG